MWEITLQCCQRGTGDDGGEVASLRLPGALRSQEDTDSFGSVTDPDLVCSAYKLVVLGRGLQTGKEQTVSLCWNLKNVFFSTFAHILYPSKLISLLKALFFFFPQLSNDSLCAISLSSSGMEEIYWSISSDKGKIVTILSWTTIGISLHTTLCSESSWLEKKNMQKVRFSLHL